jgi:hypothetical protein
MLIRRLDDVLTDVSGPRIRLLDIDVEGWERHVLDGAMDCLRQTIRGLLLAAEHQETVVLHSQRGFSMYPSDRPGWNVQ